MTFENFLWLQATVVVLGVVYLLRQARSPSGRFRWNRGPRTPPAEMLKSPRTWDSRVPQPRQRPVDGGLETATEPAFERALNVHFNFNGHSFDAYEVLGLPAGSSSERVEAAFEVAKAEALDPSAHEFYRLAREAIRKQNK